ncbi:MAG: hypothetical protein V4723_09205 [Pseudomonadota bacterium]
MAFHQTVQNLLLAGYSFPPSAPLAHVPPPAALQPLIDAVAPVHRAFDQKAVEHGHRYRSAFWLIYILSAFAVLCAVMPLALGWDDVGSTSSQYAIVWVISEILIISAVALLYWLGHHQDWQGQWLGARTKAELAWYMPLIAPLLREGHAEDHGNWYAQLFNDGQPIPANEEIDALCRKCSPIVGPTLADLWSAPHFVTEYAQWTISLLEGQRKYHQRVAARQHALLHRVHSVNTWLFGLTALAALAHLFIHSRLLTLMTTFLPALGASLHGALAQSEAYRLQATSERLSIELGKTIEPMRKVLAMPEPAEGATLLRAAVLSAVELIMDEHDDWHMLVRPHHLPLG